MDAQVFTTDHLYFECAPKSSKRLTAAEVTRLASESDSCSPLARRKPPRSCVVSRCTTPVLLQAQDEIARGRIRPACKVWCKGMREWAQLQDVRFNFVGAMPKQVCPRTRTRVRAARSALRRFRRRISRAETLSTSPCCPCQVVCAPYFHYEVAHKRASVELSIDEVTRCRARRTLAVVSFPLHRGAQCTAMTCD